MSLAQRVLLTVAYTDQFHYPLTIAEVAERLLSVSTPLDVSREVVPSVNQINLELELLLKRRLVTKEVVPTTVSTQPTRIKNQNYFSLFPRAWASMRFHRAQLSQDKQPQLEQALSALRSIPWIEAVALTGSLAMSNIAHADTDLDFMIIVSPGRLWLTRLWVSLIAWKAGRRRTWGHNQPSSWCFNLWLDTRHLSLPPDKRSPYSAYEVCQARWLFDRSEIQTRYYQENTWVSHWIPQFFARCRQEVHSSSLSKGKKKNRKTRDTRTFSLLWAANYLVYLVQLVYMWPHHTRELVGEGFAYFHPRDTRSFVFTRWKRSLVQLLHHGR